MRYNRRFAIYDVTTVVINRQKFDQLLKRKKNLGKSFIKSPNVQLFIK